MINNFDAHSNLVLQQSTFSYSLSVSGEIVDYQTSVGAMHALLSFTQETDGQMRKQRFYPLTLRCKTTKEGNCSFVGDAKIELESVFADNEDLQPEQCVNVSLWYLDQSLQWQQQKIADRMYTEQFVTQHGGEELKQRTHGILFGICTVLLPVWLFAGFLATKGIGKLSSRAQKMTGKKAVFYHANDLVKKWTGYDYSIRDVKTKYFAGKYAQAVKKIETTEGVLFLSERQVDAGGNLDRVRRVLLDESKVPVKEFLTSKTVDKLSFRELKLCAKLAAAAKIIVLEDFVPQLGAIKLRRDTEMLQMWHACGAFKLFGLSELGITDLPQNTKNHRTYTRAIVSSAALAPFYSEAFGIHVDNIRMAGVPRTDVFFDEAYRQKTVSALYERYPQWKGKKIVLFAPTFRGSGNKTAYYPMERFPIDQVMEQLPNDTVLLVKQHPFVHSDLSKYRAESYSDRLFDLTGKENINDLLFITDLLVTDYSSSIFEAALIDVPMLFYAFDLADYLADRDLYFDFAEFAPGKIVEDLPTLLETMRTMLASNQKNPVDAKFREFFLGLLDGNSTRRTVDLIYAMLNGNDQPTKSN